MRKKVFVFLLLAAAVQGLLAEDTNTITLSNESGVDLSTNWDGSDNSLPSSSGSSGSSMARVLETLERLQAENMQLRQDLGRLTGLVQELREENSRIWQQMGASASQVSELVSDVTRTVMERLRENKEMVQNRLSDFAGLAEEVKGQRGFVMQQAEMMDSVLDVVREFEDESVNVTSRLAGLEHRLSVAEGSLLQFQVEGSCCSDKLGGVQERLKSLEAAVDEMRSSGRSSLSPAPSSTPSSTFSTHGWTSGYTDSTVTSGDFPELRFTVPPSAFAYGDTLITAILVTENGKLLLADRLQPELHMSSLERPEVMEDTAYLGGIPWALLQLQDGTIVVTLEDAYKIVLFNITGNALELVKTIYTRVNYGGIAQGPGDTLIVSKWSEGNIARIDVITMDGDLERTILENVDFLIDPYCLRRYGDDVYVSDRTSQRLFRVNVMTGEVSSHIGDLDLFDLALEQPRKFDIDDSGNLYLATGGRVCNEHADGYFCVIQVTQNGTWKVMRGYIGQNGDGYPYGVEVTPTQIIISWGWWDYGWTSELTAYSLPSSAEEPSVAGFVSGSFSTAPSTIQSTIGSSEYVPPHLRFTVPSSAIEEYGNSLVTSVIITEEGKILMADYSQQVVKMSSLQHFHRLEDAVYVGQTPWSLVQLTDGVVAVTMEDQPDITFLRINGSDLEIDSEIQTKRRYRGVAEFGNDTLIVSTRRNDDDWSDLEARIDVITREGIVCDTLLTGEEFSDLVDPLYLTRRGNDVYVSDWASHRVHVLNLESRNVSSLFGSMDLSELGLYQPRVVAFDDNTGDMYVATGGRVCNPYSYRDYFCVIQVSPTGRWRNLENYTSRNGGMFPYGIDVTDSQIIISWGQWRYGGWHTELTAYDLPQSVEESSRPSSSQTPPSSTLGLESSSQTVPTSTVGTSDVFSRPTSTYDGTSEADRTTFWFK